MLCAAFGATAAFACDVVPAGEPLWIRLAAPISTYNAKPGDPIDAILTQDVVCGGDVVLPMGSLIQGTVLKKHKVGWGIVHETASLELEFTRAIPRPGVTLAITARVEDVENARETVHKGVIQGIRSSDTFQGNINSRLIHLPTWNPYSDPVLITYKALFPIFPEPEIFYPAGTDMRLKTVKEFVPPPQAVDAAVEPPVTAMRDPDSTEETLEHLPLRVETRKHVDADVVNIVFLGSEAEVQGAFREAGWHNADRPSTRALMKYLYALFNNSGYAQQPMVTFMLNGKPEDMNWQRNLNSYGRRDHVRIWRWKPEGDSDDRDAVWVSSSTHDTRAAISLKYEGFVHHIAPEIDDERAAVIRDLNFAGCVKHVSYVARPEMPTATLNATGDLMHTDGSLAVVELQECRPMEPELDSIDRNGKFKPGSYVFRYIRKEILTFRNDIWRENIIYGAYSVGRMTVTSMRHRMDAERLKETMLAGATTAAARQQASSGGSQ
jgi:LssY C-terminus